MGRNLYSWLIGFTAVSLTLYGAWSLSRQRPNVKQGTIVADSLVRIVDGNGLGLHRFANELGANDFYLSTDVSDSWRRLVMLNKSPLRKVEWNGVVHVQIRRTDLGMIEGVPDGAMIVGNLVLYGDMGYVERLALLLE